jgi:hypothetical protein
LCVRADSDQLALSLQHATRFRSVILLLEGGIMSLVGIVVTFVGFLVAASSVGVMSGNAGRLGMVLVGIIISLVGILGILNPAYQKNAVWKK